MGHKLSRSHDRVRAVASLRRATREVSLGSQPTPSQGTRSVDGVLGKTPRGERTSARLRQSARSTFADRGYVATRVEDIVSDAGVSHGTFYTYYANKSAVLDALIDDAASDLIAVVEEPWDGPDPATTVIRIIGTFVDMFAKHADVVNCWLEASVTEHHFLERLRRIRSEYVARVANVLKPALLNSRHDPLTAAAALVAMVEGYATQGLASDRPDQRSAVVDTLAALWRGGLRQLLDDGADY